MKRLFVTLSLFTVLFTSKSFASDGQAYPLFLQSFFKSFREVQNVNWSESNDHIRVSFKKDGKQNYAYYNASSELVVVSTEINLQALPEKLRTSLLSKFNQYTITGVYEFRSGDKKEYYVSLDNEKRKMVVSSSSKRWTVFSVSKK